MSVLDKLEKDLVSLPVLALLIVGLALVAVGAVLHKYLQKRKHSRTHVATVEDTFLPPILGNTLPKEETYIMPRHWKPSSTGNGVYTPLSIPLTPERSMTSLSSKVGSIIHVLPPSKSNHSQFV